MCSHEKAGSDAGLFVFSAQKIAPIECASPAFVSQAGAGIHENTRILTPIDGFMGRNRHGTQVAKHLNMKREAPLPLNVMIVDADATRRAQVVESLRRTGCSVIERTAMTIGMIADLAATAPDVIVIDADAPDRDMLEHVCIISRNQPRPIVMFTDDDDAAKIKQAIRAGVTSYIVKGIDPARIKPILQVAMTRFEEHQALRRDLTEAQTQLAERKLIERAKGIVMKQKDIGEDEAYRLLRKMAMDRNAKLADIAAQVVDLAEAFG